VYKNLKQIVYKIYGFVSALKYPKALYLSFKYSFNQKILTNKEHMVLASNWLVDIQNGDGGYARKFSLISGRDDSYIETTGYIIPTLLNMAKYFNENSYKKSAIKAGEWLLNIQNSDGSFSEIDDNRPFAFDTGQVLIGLNQLFLETEDERYQEAAKRASYWLADNQESDGSWEMVAYNRQKHSYYTRVSSAMLAYALVENDTYIEKQALKNIEWVVSQQQENGYFNHASFLEEVPAYLHTLIYILEGLLDVYEMTKDEKILEVILRNANRLKEINLGDGVLLCSQYNSDFRCTNGERCITGLAQWAGVCLRLFEITEDKNYKEIAISTLFYLKSKQIQEGGVLKGALSASVPFWGRYGAFSFVNWGNKFFIDSLLLLDKYKLDIKEEQEYFVSLAFSLNETVVYDALTAMDRAYLKKIDDYFKPFKEQSLTLLDLGCGRGRFLDYFTQNYPKWKVIGVEPTFEKEGSILKGSAYDIPVESNSIDILFSIEVLQHTYIDDSMREIERVLKKEAHLVIGERNPWSVLGILKPLLELKGRWMYPWDSPFREKWYGKSQWRDIFGKYNIEMKQIETINNPRDKKVKFLNRYYFMVGEMR